MIDLADDVQLQLTLNLGDEPRKSLNPNPTLNRRRVFIPPTR